MPLSETSNDIDDERKMDLMDLDFCSFLDGECNEKLDSDEAGFSSTKSITQRNRSPVWRDIRDNNNLEYSLISNYGENCDGIQMERKPAASMALDSTDSNSSIQTNPQETKQTNRFESSNNQENRESTLDLANRSLPSTNQRDNSPADHVFRPDVRAQLHPQAIQSSAACPPHDALNMTQAAINTIASVWGGNSFMMNIAAGAQPASVQNEALKDNSAHSFFPSEKNLPINSNISTDLYANFLASQKTRQSIDSFYQIPMHGFDTNQEETGRSKETTSCSITNKGVKNAKEQKRAQQITNLIEQLRVKMEEDGWKVEVNSKFHTLSSCARYLKHLKSANADKERAIREMKNKLEAEKLRVEDESAQQERSEPESTFSDLTDSSTSARISGKIETGANESHDLKHASAKIRKMERFMVSHQSTVSSSASTGAENEAKTTITEPTASSLSASDVSAKRNVERESKASGSKRSISSSNSALQLDFHDVFIQSNIPQVLAVNSGKIVAWNAFFLEITGLEPKEAQRLTIFSLVSSRELSTLFEFVAEALRTSSQSEKKKANTSEQINSAVTLPCVSFPRISKDASFSRPLFMTVTRMNDVDPRKRCFHVVFSDQSVSDGRMGSISRDLLTMLFARPNGSSLIYPKYSRKTHKKRKQSA